MKHLKSIEDLKSMIGKRIFRDKSTCPCPDCLGAEETGIIVRDEEHAEYLADIQATYAIEGILLNYRDEK